MSENSKIEWTTHTFNGWWGCTKVHAGCKNCYAEAWDARWGGDHWGNNPRRMILGEWSKPAQWNKAAADAGEIHRVFCSSMCDVFEDYEGPVVDQQGKRVEFTGKDTMGVRAGQFDYEGGKVYWSIPALRERVFAIIEATPNLEWLLLTKRPENVRRMVPAQWLESWPKNVRTGTSPCDQSTADLCIPKLLNVPGPLFLSCEPLIGPIDFRKVPGFNLAGTRGVEIIRRMWVIVGGESGERPCDVAWIRSIVSQCKAASVPVFVKQMGASAIAERGVDYQRDPTDVDGHAHYIHRAHLPLWFPKVRLEEDPVLFKFKDRKGGDPSEWPEDLRVREFPEVRG